MALVSTLHLGCSSHSSTIMLPGPDMIIDGPPVMVSRSLLPYIFHLCKKVPPWIPDGSVFPDLPYIRSTQDIPLQKLTAGLHPP